MTETGMGASPIRVLVADDHPLLRDGLVQSLLKAPGVEVVGEAEDGEDALDQILALQPTVAILDCELPGMSGAEVATEVRRLGLPTRIVALSGYEDGRHIAGMLLAGALGYLVKGERRDAVLAAVRAVARGERWFSEPVECFVRAWADRNPFEEVGLTSREIDVLSLLARGLSNREMSLVLDVTENTVESHVGHVLRKLRIESRLQAGLWARHHGLG